MLIERKVAAGSSAAVVTGFITWVLVSFVPAFRAGLPPELATVLPYAVAWLLGTVAAYRAPHTPRPDLVPPPPPAGAAAPAAGAAP